MQGSTASLGNMVIRHAGWHMLPHCAAEPARLCQAELDFSDCRRQNSAVIAHRENLDVRLMP